MKINDIVTSEIIIGEEVMEGNFRDYALAGIASASMLGGMYNADRLSNIDKEPTTVTKSINLPTPAPQPDREVEPSDPIDHEADENEAALRGLARAIAKKYRVSEDLVNNIVYLAHKYEDETFPRAIDILAVIAVESSFNPKAVSRLKRDPARGLMQVRPGVWGLNISDLNNIEQQIRIGARILNKYYDRTKDADSALQAYNVGITNFRRGKTNPRYSSKVARERETFSQYLTSL